MEALLGWRFSNSKEDFFFPAVDPLHAGAVSKAHAFCGSHPFATIQAASWTPQRGLLWLAIRLSAFGKVHGFYSLAFPTLKIFKTWLSCFSYVKSFSRTMVLWSRPLMVVGSHGSPEKHRFLTHGICPNDVQPCGRQSQCGKKARKASPDRPKGAIRSLRSIAARVSDRPHTGST